jgi:hypothetical protein
MTDINSQIQSLKEKIYNLREYLHSDICRQCGDAAIKLEEYLLDLEEFLKKV